MELRARIEAAVEALIALLDTMDGDPDLELSCEDEGAQCDDEGAIEHEGGGYMYADDGQGGVDQRRFANATVDVQPNLILGAR